MRQQVKPRNPIAKAVKLLRPQVLPDKRGKSPAQKVMEDIRKITTDDWKSLDE